MARVPTRYSLQPPNTVTPSTFRAGQAHLALPRSSVRSGVVSGCYPRRCISICLFKGRTEAFGGRVHVLGAEKVGQTGDAKLFGKLFVEGDHHQLRSHGGEAFGVSPKHVDERRADVAALAQAQNDDCVPRLRCRRRQARRQRSARPRRTSSRRAGE